MSTQKKKKEEKNIDRKVLMTENKNEKIHFNKLKDK